MCCGERGFASRTHVFIGLQVSDTVEDDVERPGQHPGITGGPGHGVRLPTGRDAIREQKSCQSGKQEIQTLTILVC